MLNQKRSSVFLMYVLFFVLSAVSIVFISKCSPIYLYCTDADHIIFSSVAEKMKDGAVIYRDVFDHKGPYWYFFYYFLQILTPGSTISVWFFDILSRCIFFYYLYKTVNLLVIDFREACLLTCVFGFLSIMTPVSNSAKTDEFALPFAMYAVFILVKYMVQRIPMHVYFIVGLHMGLWFWTKFTILLFYLGCFVFLIFDRSEALWKGVLVIVSGMAVTTVPVFIYFIANGALDSLWEVYFGANLFNYSNLLPFGEKIIINFCNWLFTFMPFLILFVAYLLMMSRNAVRQKIFMDVFAKNKRLFFMMAILYFFSVVPIMLVACPCYYNYFAQAISVTSLFFILLFYYSFADNRFDDVSIKFKAKSAQISLVCLSLVVSFIFGFLGWISNYAPVSFVFESDFSNDPHYAVFEYIKSHGGSTLLVYGSLDDGFSDILGYEYLIDDRYVLPVNTYKSDILQHYRDNMHTQSYDYIIYIYGVATGKYANVVSETKSVFDDVAAESGYKLCLHVTGIKDYFLYALPAYAE